MTTHRAEADTLPRQPEPIAVVRRLSVDHLVTPRPGRAFAEEPEIVVAAAAWTRICRHAASELRREVGGLLLGQVYSSDGRLQVLIDDVVPARDAISRVASLEFTLATWQHFFEEKALRPTETVVTGWYHTHPGFGLFLSQSDVFIQRYFFSQPWHLALVVDPLAQAAAFFLLTQGNLARRDDFLLRMHGRELGDAAASPSEDQGTESAQIIERSPKRTSFGFEATARRLRDTFLPHTPGQPADRSFTSVAAPEQSVHQVTARRISISDLSPILSWPAPPTTVVIAGGALCIALPAGRLLAGRVGEPEVHQIMSPGDIQAVTYGPGGELWALVATPHALWRWSESGDECQLVPVKPRSKWRWALPAGLLACGNQILVWDVNDLLVLEPGPDKLALMLKAVYRCSGCGAPDGAYQQAVAGRRLYINNPIRDCITILDLTTGSHTQVISGAMAGFRDVLALATTGEELFVLDSEGTRILVLDLNGMPQWSWVLNEDSRIHNMTGLVADEGMFYLVAADGLYRLDRRKQ
jgi:proteasome lid subunit RPN8/RPN11